LILLAFLAGGAAVNHQPRLQIWGKRIAAAAFVLYIVQSFFPYRPETAEDWIGARTTPRAVPAPQQSRILRPGFLALWPPGESSGNLLCGQKRCRTFSTPNYSRPSAMACCD
jgi:hypothetical protein